MTAPAPPTTTEQWCALLDELDLGEWRPTTAGGTIFLRALPRDPATAVAVSLTQSGPADGRNGYDMPALLVRVRGEPNDPAGTERRAQAIWDALHGLGKRVLPGGLRVERCFAASSGPLFVTRDEQGRDEWSAQFDLELRRPTANRH